MTDPVSVFERLPEVAAEASEAETTDPEASVNSAESVAPLMFSESA
jgi:hypothetical protein